LPAAILDHFGDGGLFCAGAADCLLHVAASIIFAVGCEDAGANGEFGIWAICLGSGLDGEFVHLFQAIGLHICGELYYQQ
jgi:hypothetical protein